MTYFITFHLKPSEAQDAADAPAGVFFSRDPICWRLISSNAGFKAALSPRMQSGCQYVSHVLAEKWVHEGRMARFFSGSPENTKNWFWVSVMFPISVTFVSQNLSTDVPLLVDFTHDFHTVFPYRTPEEDSQGGFLS